MTDLNSVLKNRNITLQTKVKNNLDPVFTFFPVFTFSCESWTIKKAELLRNYAFKLWRWRRLLKVPWTASRSNQSILRDINPEVFSIFVMLCNYHHHPVPEHVYLPRKPHTC